ncbi:MAG: HD domain-containing protein [Ignisphaera sp.]
MSNIHLSDLLKFAEDIKNEKIRRIVIDILTNPILSFSSVKPLIDIEESPAAPRKHHMFTGGLIVHTYSVIKIALMLCSIFEEVYGVSIDRDLVIASALLHDIYKYYQYTKDVKEGGYKAREDWYLSHDYAIVAELASRGAGDELIRVVSEVHGIVPIRTYEGFIVHLADSIDARFGEYHQNNILMMLRYFENNSCKPYAMLDEIVKKFGVKIMARLYRDRDILSNIVVSICTHSSSNTM